MGFGASLSGYFKSEKGNESVRLDPQTFALNQFRLNAINQLPQYGGIEGPYANVDRYSYLDPYTSGVLSQGINAARAPGLTTDQWYNQALSGLDPSQARQNIQGYYGDLDQAIQGYAGNLFGAGNSYYNQILGPQVGSEFALMGLGRSGGRQEAEARAAASVALPIQQQLSQMRFGAGQAEAGALTGLEGQYLQNLYGLNQARPGVDINLRDAELRRLGEAVDFSDYARQQRQQAAQTQLQSWLSLINATPYTPSVSRFRSGRGWGVSGQASYSSAGAGA